MTFTQKNGLKIFLDLTNEVEMEVKNRRSITKRLDYDYLHSEDDYIEVTEWANGEGYDIATKKGITSFTHAELESIHELVTLFESGLIKELGHDK